MQDKRALHIVGNRPQFIKLAPVSKAIRSRGYLDDILHTGQHYDANMSDVFFEELGIPKPSVNLNIGSGSHAEMTGKAMIAIEDYLKETMPKSVILYGDTDSTLAGVLAAAKLNIPIVHIEAGPRTNSKSNPEEQNRIVVDHLSDWLFCPDQNSLTNLQKEGCGDKAIFAGDVMYDAFLNVSKIQSKNALSLVKDDEEFILMTWHRMENTSSREKMDMILNMVSRVGEKVICPLHPRTKNMLNQFGLWEKAIGIDNFKIIDPVGYFEMVQLANRCKLIITDSGGLSKESFFAGVKCLFMVELDVWIPLQEIGWIRHVDFSNPNYIDFVRNMITESSYMRESTRPEFYGDGHAAEKIVDFLIQKDLL